VSETVYHMELRHFPRNLCRFNVSGEELRATVLEPWAADRPFELGELRWDPRQARLTVIEGPRLPPGQLSMGRGWRTAQRQGRDVTEQLLAATAQALAAQASGLAPGSVPRSVAATDPADAGRPGTAAGPADAQKTEMAVSAGPVGEAAPPPPAPASTPTFAGGTDADLVADSLGLELLAQIGDGRILLRSAWELAGARHPHASAGETLAVAERAVASLLRARLIVLLRAAGPRNEPEPVGAGDAAPLLRARESWVGEQVWVDRT
jgi:hypothetical protein